MFPLAFMLSLSLVQAFSNITYPYDIIKLYDLNDCICEHCQKMSTVGKMLNGKCYYINMNDILFSNNTLVHQLSSKDIRDIDLADSLFSHLAAEAFVKFRVPLINFNLEESRYFERNNSQKRKCFLLNTERNFTVFESNYKQCSPEVSILQTIEFQVLQEIDPDIRYGTYIGHSQIPNELRKISSFENCANKTISAVIDDQCIFLDDEHTECDVVAVSSPSTFKLLEQFLVGQWMNMSRERCKDDPNWAKCILTGDSQFKTFIVYISDEEILKFGSTSYFAISGDKTGFYAADVSKRRMTFIASSIHNNLENSQYAKSATRLCGKSRSLSTEPTDATSPFSIVTVEERQTTPALNMTSELEDTEMSVKHRDSATTVIFILTSVMTIIGIVSIFLCKFWDQVVESVLCCENDDPC